MDFLGLIALDANGATVSGALASVFVNNTTTPVDTFSDSALEILQPKPVVANSAGVLEMYVPRGTYRVDLTDPNGDSLPGYPRDDVENRDPVAEVEEAIAASEVALGAAAEAEDSAGLAETYAGVVSRATTVQGLTDPSTVADASFAIVSGSGDDDIDGLYQESSDAWVRLGKLLLSDKADADTVHQMQVRTDQNGQPFMGDVVIQKLIEDVCAKLEWNAASVMHSASLKQILNDEMNRTNTNMTSLLVVTLKEMVQAAMDRSVGAAFALLPPFNASSSEFVHSSSPFTESVGFSTDGFNVTVSGGLTALSAAETLISPVGTVTVSPPTTGSITGEARTLSYSANEKALRFAAGDGALEKSGVSNVVVTRLSDSAVLEEDADYRLNSVQGSIVLMSDIGDVDVLVDYDWSSVRYDLIETDFNGNLTIVEGTNRDRDVAEYLPERTSGKIPLLVVRVDQNGVTAWQWRDPEETLLSAPALIQRKRARRLPNLQAALRGGVGVTHAGYGDSRTAMGGTTDYYVANGPMRDRATDSYLADHSADFIATIPLYDFGDGEGAVHTKIGANWVLNQAIQDQYGIPATYLNFGISGTTSEATAPSGKPNGLDPTRLAALTASGASMAVISFGMNELGDTSSETTSNLVAIGEACMGASIDPVFIPPTRPNFYRHDDTLEDWLIECRQVQAAADYLQSPCIDLLPIIGGTDVRGMLDPRDMANANGYNHDGVYEQNLQGVALSRILLDL